MAKKCKRKRAVVAALVLSLALCVPAFAWVFPYTSLSDFDSRLLILNSESGENFCARGDKVTAVYAQDLATEQGVLVLFYRPKADTEIQFVFVSQDGVVVGTVAENLDLKVSRVIPGKQAGDFKPCDLVSHVKL